MLDEKRLNLKAPKFEQFLKENKLNFFEKSVEDDDADTVVFKSNLKVEGQIIPFGIITDNTIYTIIRVPLGDNLVKDTNRESFMAYLNKLNRSYKVFKYMADDDGSVYLDSCIPCSNDSFDPSTVRVVLDVIVDHLNTEYKNIMKHAWN